MRALLFFLVMMIAAAVAAQDSMVVHYKIYDTRGKQVIGIDKIVADMAEADVLFFGEDHSDSAGHYLENKIFRTLHAQYGGQLVLSMEMFETDNQLVLDEYLHGRIDEKRLANDARLWKNYRDYRPMVEFAKENKLAVIAANPPAGM